MNSDLGKFDGDQSQRKHRRRWTTWSETAGTTAAIWLVIYFRPFTSLFGLESFERQHGTWVEVAILCAALIVSKTVYLWGFRRRAQLAELAIVKTNLRQGRISRMSLAARCTLLLLALGLVIIGWYAPIPYGPHILAVSAPLFLVFATVELNLVLHPGEALIADPQDELLMFFRARMLKVGYTTAIAAVVVLYLVSLLAPAYVGLLIPIALTVSLIVPSFVYRRLDRQAGTDG